MAILKTPHAEDRPNLHGISAKPTHATEHTHVTMMTLAPGETLHPHITQVDLFLNVLQARSIVKIDGECAIVERDGLVISPATLAHRLLTAGTETFRFLAVKTQAQKEGTRIL